MRNRPDDRELGFQSVDVLVLPTLAFDPPIVGRESPDEAGVSDWLGWARAAQ